MSGGSLEFRPPLRFREERSALPDARVEDLAVEFAPPEETHPGAAVLLPARSPGTGTPNAFAPIAFSSEGGVADLRGAMVGGYRVEHELGRGATSVVYLAVHPLLGTRAAVKVLSSARSDLVERFIGEARAVASLRHPHIVQLYDLVSLPNGRLCIVTEHLEGETLETAAGSAPMSPTRVRRILLQVCSALAAAHRRGIIHRDLKAQNILLLQGSEDAVKLLDFGLAKTESESPGSTHPGIVLGTPHYMAPEQARGEPVDRRTDIYALGVLAYRLLAGHVPFAGCPTDVLRQHVQDVPRVPAHVPARLREIVEKALAKRREERFANVAELGRALYSCTLEPTGRDTGVAAPRRVAAAPFQVRTEGRSVVLRFDSEAAYAHLELHALSRGRLFVPGIPPEGSGELMLVLEVPGRAPVMGDAVVLGVYDERLAAKHGIVRGYVIALRGTLRPRMLLAAPFQQQDPFQQEGPFQQQGASPSQLGPDWSEAAPSVNVPVHHPRSRRYRMRIPAVLGEPPGITLTGATLNLSAAGLEMLSPYPVETGIRVVVTLNLVPQEPAHVVGVVIWSRQFVREDGAMNAQLGLHLVSVDDGYRRFLEELAGGLSSAATLVTGRIKLPART